MRKVICDSCQNEFKINIKTERVGKMFDDVIKFKYFQCKKCKAKYFVGVDSKRIRGIQRELKVHDIKEDRVRELRDELKDLFNKTRKVFSDWK